MKNNKAELAKWATKTLAESTLALDIRERMEAIAIRLILDGYRRGDISDAWRRLSPKVNQATVPDLYV